MLNQNTNAQTANGDAKLQINATTGTCLYGTSIDMGSTWYSANSVTLTTGFLNSDNTAPWSCTDTEGDATRSLQLGMTSNLVNSWNASVTISSGNVLVSNGAATNSNGTCTPASSPHTNTPLSGMVALFWKSGNIGQTCTVSITWVNISIVIPAGQAPWIYSWSLQVAYSSDFGDGIMN